MAGGARVSGAFAFNVDEVGIAYGRFRELRLKSCYQPLFRVEDDLLMPFAVEALVIAFTGGKAVPAAKLFERAAAGERAGLERLCRVLHMRNYHNIGVDGLELFFNVDPAMSDEDVEHLDWLFAENEIAPGMVVCEITEAFGAGTERVTALCENVRRSGMRVAVDDFGAGHSTPARLRLIRPDIVKLDAAWFQKIVADNAAREFLPRLFARFHELGTKVLVEGIETPEQLLVAIAAGADHLQGFLLARPALAGTIFDDAALSVAALSSGAAPGAQATSR